jgi:RNA polymerase subunit RPABC4/transcription elongation factor Spt4
MYCSYCAGVLDPNLPMCPLCGRPGTAETQVAVVAVSRPASVTIAGTLLIVCLVLSILSLAGILITPTLLSRLPVSFWARTFGFWMVWTVFLIFFWQRQNWTRFAIMLLVLWNVGNLALNFRASFSLIVPILIAAIRVGAAYLMFKPESDAWFKKRAA